MELSVTYLFCPWTQPEGGRVPHCTCSAGRKSSFVLGLRQPDRPGTRRRTGARSAGAAGARAPPGARWPRGQARAARGQRAARPPWLARHRRAYFTWVDGQPAAHRAPLPSAAGAAAASPDDPVGRGHRARPNSAASAGRARRAPAPPRAGRGGNRAGALAATASRAALRRRGVPGASRAPPTGSWVGRPDQRVADGRSAEAASGQPPGGGRRRCPTPVADPRARHAPDRIARAAVRRA